MRRCIAGLHLIHVVNAHHLANAADVLYMMYSAAPRGDLEQRTVRLTYLYKSTRCLVLCTHLLLQLKNTYEQHTPSLDSCRASTALKTPPQRVARLHPGLLGV